MTIETAQELEGLRTIGRIVATVMQQMMDHAEPGMSTAELDAYGGELLEHYGARSAPRLAYNFPGHTCISINEEAAHGIPGTRIIAAGDLVNVDVSAELGGYYADTGGSFVVPPIAPAKQRICDSTKLALRRAMQTARAGRPLNHIGRAIEKTAKEKGYRVIKNLCSHGVGRSLHEEPKEIPGYFVPQDRRVLQEGQVITIEPFLSTKTRYVSEAADGWTLVGQRGNLSAQYEHTMVITRGEPIILTLAG
jgi:methionyl aminopeptidase